jgi:hypothetical protein
MNCFVDEELTLPYVRLTSDDEPFVGQMVQLCAAGFATGPMHLIVRAPDYGEYRTTIEVLPDGEIYRQVPGPMTRDRLMRAIEVDRNGETVVFQTEAWFLDASVQSGIYQMTLTQGALSASHVVTVLPDAVPRIRALADGPEPGDLTFAVMGYEPMELVPIGIYRFAGESASGESRYELALELEPVQVDERGFATFHVNPESLGLEPNPAADSFRDFCMISAGLDTLEGNQQCSIGWGRQPRSGFHGPPDASVD